MSSALHAIVWNGRLVVNEPTDLHEGTELWLLPTEGDGEFALDARAEDGRAHLVNRIERGLDETDQGLVVPAAKAQRRMSESRGW